MMKTTCLPVKGKASITHLTRSVINRIAKDISHSKTALWSRFKKKVTPMMTMSLLERPDESYAGCKRTVISQLAMHLNI